MRSIPAESATIATFRSVTNATALDYDIHGRRAARMAAGSALIGGALMLIASTVSPELRAFDVIASSWAAALALYVVARLAVPHLARVLGWRRTHAGDAAAIPSWTIPLAGFTLIAPLSLHAIVGFINGDNRDFEEWCGMSFIIVGHVHVLLAVMIGLHFTRRWNGEKAWPLGRIWLASIGAACVPGALLLLIPPLLVGVTALPMLLVYAAATYRLEAEQRALTLRT
jgi:hypothetical protein